MLQANVFELHYGGFSCILYTQNKEAYMYPFQTLDKKSIQRAIVLYSKFNVRCKMPSNNLNIRQFSCYICQLVKVQVNVISTRSPQYVWCREPKHIKMKQDKLRAVREVQRTFILEQLNKIEEAKEDRTAVGINVILKTIEVKQQTITSLNEKNFGYECE